MFYPLAWEDRYQADLKTHQDRVPQVQFVRKGTRFQVAAVRSSVPRMRS